MRLLLLLFTLGSAALGVVAQSSPRPDPADPAAPVAVVKRESAFADYQPFQTQKVAPWKGINDAVSGTPMAGGHAGHGGMMMAPARENPTPSSGNAEKPAEKTMPGHDMHEMDKGEKK